MPVMNMHETKVVKYVLREYISRLESKDILKLGEIATAAWGVKAKVNEDKGTIDFDDVADPIKSLVYRYAAERIKGE